MLEGSLSQLRRIHHSGSTSFIVIFSCCLRLCWKYSVQWNYSLGTNSVLERYRSDLFLLNRGWCETTVQLATLLTVRACLMIFIIYLYCGYSQVTERIASFARMTCRVRYYKSICGSFRNFNRVKINGTYQHCIYYCMWVQSRRYVPVWLCWASHNYVSSQY